VSAARFDLPRRLLAEALGTAFLLATVVGSGVMAEKLAGGNLALALLCNTIPTGAILVVLVTILGPVSGAHLNPAVSAALALRRELPMPELIAYVLAQFAGGIAGCALAHGMFELPLVQFGATARTGPGQWLGEITAAFGLLLTIFGGVRFRPAAVPWCVGLYIAAAYWFTSSTSFANPAVTVARGLSDTFAGIRPADVPAFIVAQFAGAVAASLVAGWLFTEPREDQRSATITCSGTGRAARGAGAAGTGSRAGR
jgi:glycerol uptake facilitator-like aquaporin